MSYSAEGRLAGINVMTGSLSVMAFMPLGCIAILS